MRGHRKTSVVLFICCLAASNAFQTPRVLHIPEKIIGGVIDIVQNHKNKPTTPQPGFQGQGQAQQQIQQGYGWNTGYQSQNQAQFQYANQAYPQTGNNYPQSGYVNTGQNTGAGYQQFSGNQGSYQNYPQPQPNGQFQGQQSGQFQNQMQNGYQGQQSQIQVQNQQYQNQQTGQFANQNQQTNVNFQGTQQVINQPVGQSPPTGTYGGGQQSSNFVQTSGNYVGQNQPTQNYVPSNPQGQAPQSTFIGTNQFQGQTGTGGSYGGSQGFQMTSGSTAGGAGPSCICQAFTKPVNGPKSETPTQRNEDEAKTE